MICGWQIKSLRFPNQNNKLIRIKNQTIRNNFIVLRADKQPYMIIKAIAQRADVMQPQMQIMMNYMKNKILTYGLLRVL